MLKQIYCALIYPYLSYEITFWGCASSTRLNCILILSKISVCETIFFTHMLGKEYAALVTHKIENETDSIANVFLGVLTLISHMYNYNGTKFANKPKFLDREYSLI